MSITIKGLASGARKGVIAGKDILVHGFGNPDAKKIEDITWAEFKKIIPDKWDPGLSSPFDPVAAREAEAKNIEVAIINGNNLNELKNYLNKKPFVGTHIHT